MSRWEALPRTHTLGSPGVSLATGAAASFSGAPHVPAAVPQIADLGLSRIIVEEDAAGGSSLAATNPRWLAPELLLGKPATTASGEPGLLVPDGLLRGWPPGVPACAAMDAAVSCTCAPIACLSADCFSFGVVMWEMLAWKLPWGRRDPWQVR